MEKDISDVQMNLDHATLFHSYVMNILTATMDQMRNTVTYVRHLILLWSKALL